MLFSLFFFFNDTATTEIYTLSLHDALPIWPPCQRPLNASRTRENNPPCACPPSATSSPRRVASSRSSFSCSGDRKSTRLNSSHANISYAVFCLKKKKTHAV